MSDARGRMDRPGANPLNSARIFCRGRVRTNCYWHHNARTQKFEVVRLMPVGTPDLVLKEFDSLFVLRNWTDAQLTIHGRIF